MQKLVADTIHYLTDLVSYNSVSHETNLPVITYIQNILLNAGVESMVLPSPDGRKANLLARIGPEVAGGIVLSGHTDVVPVEGQPWETDPFILTEKDGKLFGRGSADMKSFIAACLAFIPEFKRLPLKRPIYFAFSYDEEIGCLGVPHLLKYITAQVPKPAFAIIGEPTLMQVVTAHKGVLSFETTVHGLEWHSSQPHYGVNAVHIACDLVHYLSSLAKELSRTGMKDERFDPPHSTVHVGIIHGGTARNIIPRECHFNWEIRPLPTDNADALAERFKSYCAELQQAHPGSSITTVPKSRMMGVTLPAHATEASQMVMHCARKNQEHAVAFGTEAGVFNEYGIPAIVCGPGNIEQAHKPNEFIEISQLEACADFLLRLCEQVR